jgi:hypothetical protein
LGSDADRTCSVKGDAAGCVDGQPAYSDGDFYTDSYVDVYPYSNANQHRHGDGHANRHSPADGHTHAHCHAN